MDDDFDALLRGHSSAAGEPASTATGASADVSIFDSHNLEELVMGAAGDGDPMGWQQPQTAGLLSVEGNAAADAAGAAAGDAGGGGFGGTYYEGYAPDQAAYGGAHVEDHEDADYFEERYEDATAAAAGGLADGDSEQEQEQHEEEKVEEQITVDWDKYPLPPLPEPLPQINDSDLTPDDVYALITELRRVLDTDEALVRETLLSSPDSARGVLQVLHESGLLRRPVAQPSGATEWEIAPPPRLTVALPPGYASWTQGNTDNLGMMKLLQQPQR